MNTFQEHTTAVVDPDPIAAHQPPLSKRRPRLNEQFLNSAREAFAGVMPSSQTVVVSEEQEIGYLFRFSKVRMCHRRATW
jgi:hypothetical protein